MEIHYKQFLISDDKELLQFDKVCELLSTTKWAHDRKKEIIQKSIENSLCFGVYLNEIQIGFARCVTDYAVVYWLDDVVIDSEHRGAGLGKALIKAITEHERLQPLKGMLATGDAHGLYEKFGFSREEFMRKKP